MRTRNRDRGFTLIELLIVVTIILIIAAFTIPKLTKSTIPAHEASAIASIKAISEAEMIYASSHPDLGRKSGFTFTYTAGEKVNGAIRSYTITAVPDQVGTTGQRRFFSDETGEIRQSSSGVADASSPELQ